MEQLKFVIDVPRMVQFDKDEITKELSRYAYFLIMNPMPKARPMLQDPFAVFSEDWGGEGDANIIADQIHKDRSFNRSVEAW